MLSPVPRFRLHDLTLNQLFFKVRSDPAEHVRNAVDQVKAAREMTKQFREENYKKRRGISDSA